MDAQSECLLLLHSCSCLNLLNLRQTKVKQINYMLETKPNPWLRHTTCRLLILVTPTDFGWVGFFQACNSAAGHGNTQTANAPLCPSSASWHQQQELHWRRPAVSRGEHRARCRTQFPASPRLQGCSLQKAVCLLTALSHLLLCQSITSPTLQQLQQLSDCYFLMGLGHGSGKGQFRLELAEERAGPHSQETREGRARLERKGNKTPLLGLLNCSAAPEMATEIKTGMPVCVTAPITATAGGRAELTWGLKAPPQAPGS